MSASIAATTKTCPDGGGGETFRRLPVRLKYLEILPRLKDEGEDSALSSISGAVSETTRSNRCRNADVRSIAGL